MQFKKRESVEGNFAKKGEDIKAGDTITIKDGGKEVEGQYGTQNIFKIATANGEFLLSVNQTSINAMVEAWGEESTKWVGQQVKVHSMKQNVSGKFMDVFYIAPAGFEMGEYGFEKPGVKTQEQRFDEIPGIQEPDVEGQGYQGEPEIGQHTEEDKISADQIPF